MAGGRVSRARMAVAVLALVVVAVGCAGQDGADSGGGPGEVTTIELATIPPFTVTTWPVVVAQHQGYFDREGIEVNATYTFDGGQLLAGGQVDVLNDGGDSGLIAAARGKDVIFVAPVALQVTDGILGAPDITTVEQLRGETLRSAGFSTDEFLAERFLEGQGISADEIDFVAVEDDGAAIVQLERGEIAGGMFDQGFLVEAERTGEFNVLAQPADFGTYPWNVIQTTSTYADANPEAVTGFIAAIQDAMAFIQDPANRDAVIEAVVAEGEDQTSVEDTYEAAGSFDLYSFDPLSTEDIQPALDFLIWVGEDVEGIELEPLIENRYFEAAGPGA
jgi:NitT/TauT family transport system substrate-binding protein